MKELKEQTLNQWLKMSEEKRTQEILNALETAPFELKMLVEDFLDFYGLNAITRNIEYVILYLVVGFSFKEISIIYKRHSTNIRQKYAIAIHRLQHPRVSRETAKIIKNETIENSINTCLINL